MSTATTTERRATRDGIGIALRTPIQLWLAVLFMAFAFGAGLTIGVIAQRSESPAIGVTQTNQAPSNFGIAPPLTDQQLQQGLPAGHPAVGTGQDTGGIGSGSGSGAGSDSSTGGGNGGGQQDGTSSGTG